MSTEGSNRPNTPSAAAYVGAFSAVYVIWGSTYLAIRVAVSVFPPFLMAGSRFLVAGLLLSAWLVATRGFRPTKRQWIDSAIMGALLLGGGNGMVTWAEQEMPSGITVLIISIVPLLVALADWALPGGRRPTGASILGILLGLAGLCLLVGPGGAGSINPFRCAGLFLGAVCWTAGSLYSRFAREPAEPLTGATAQMICGGIFMLLIALVRGEFAHFAFAQIALRPATAWLYLVFVGALVGFSCYVWLLKHSTPARAATYAYVNPVVAVFLGWWLLGEPLTGRTLFASAVIIAGVAIITSQKALAPKPEPA